MRKTLLLCSMAAMLGGGCAPTLSFVSYEPGVLEPRGARRFVIVEGEGKVRAREQVADLLADELHGGWYKVKDRSDDGVKLVLSGSDATIVPENARGIGDEDMWLRADVVGWRIGPAVQETKTDDGKVVIQPLVRAEVVLQITVADDRGRVLIREQEYAGVADAPVGPELLERDLLESAARQAVSQFASQVEPRRIAWKVQLDDEDPRQDAIVEGIKDGAIGSARKALERLVKQSPNNAAAHYNLAVVLDAQGVSRTALKHYDRAIELRARDFYFTAREGCAHRVGAMDALYGAPPPKKKRPPRDADDDDKNKGKGSDNDRDDDDEKRERRSKERDPAGSAPPAPG